MLHAGQDIKTAFSLLSISVKMGYLGYDNQLFKKSVIYNTYIIRKERQRERERIVTQELHCEPHSKESRNYFLIADR